VGVGAWIFLSGAHGTKLEDQFMASNSGESLPPGQRLARRFERFGLPTFAFYRGSTPTSSNLWLCSNVGMKQDILSQIKRLPRHSQVSDFHCVTTWSVKELRWEGYRFSDIYEQLIRPGLNEGPEPGVIIFRGDDNYVTSLPLGDALGSDVMLADTLNGLPLSFSHGAPMRLVAPKHYGYKNVKHLRSIELGSSERDYTFTKPWPRLMEHPRARVEYEERGRYLGGQCFRILYLPLIWPTRLLFRLLTHRN
jgi:hypothetical protein